MRMQCQCDSVTHMHGRDGQDYAKAHLVKIKVDDENWIVLHQCPVTGKYWKEHSPRSGEHGGGPPEFDQISDVQSENRIWNLTIPCRKGSSRSSQGRHDGLSCLRRERANNKGPRFMLDFLVDHSAFRGGGPLIRRTKEVPE